jgi:hypothetical protein
MQAEASKQAEALQGAEQAVRQLGQQLQQQVAADLGRQQGEVQQLLARHSAEVARDTIKQFRADQVRWLAQALCNQGRKVGIRGCKR